MIGEKKAEFARLFQEFIKLYIYTPAGLSHKNTYIQQRQQERRNFEAIAAANSGEDVTESVLLPLLPYKDSPTYRHKGTYIHIDSSITGHLRKLLEKFRWTQIEDWPFLTQAVVGFIRRCNEDPSQLLAACTEFSVLPYAKNFQMPTLTPILNALRPNDFLLINNISRQVINYFANTSYTHKLTDYSAINVTGHKLIAKFANQMQQPGVPAMRDNDLFDMFSYWLVALKQYDFIRNHNPRVKKVELQPEYTLAECAEETGFDETELKRWIRNIKRKKQAIIYGSPGTGKTFIAQKLAKHLISGGVGFSELVQFHPAYSYEDFIQGIRPQTQDGQLTYSLVRGRFLEFCKKAESTQDTCVLIIDEINRANLPQVFGELMYLLEYRDKEIPLAGGNIFRIPANVRVIGTMNTADRSIAQIDHALRRRFVFIELRPNYGVLRRKYEKIDFPVERLIEILQQVNQAIADKNYELGISFFLTDNLREDIQDIWRMEIEPYLEEYFFNQPEKVDDFRWDKVMQHLQL